MADAANVARELCSDKYIFYIQANEVVHEKSAERLKSFPKERPHIELFHLPYFHIIGKNFVFAEEFRARFAKNISGIRVRGDAGFMSYGKLETAKKMMKALRQPRSVIAPYGFDSPPFTHAILPMPIFRYTALYKSNYIKKKQERLRISNESESGSIKIEIKDVGNSKDFEVWCRDHFKDKTDRKNPYLLGGATYALQLDEHPKIMQELLKRNITSYYVRDSLLKRSIGEL